MAEVFDGTECSRIKSVVRKNDSLLVIRRILVAGVLRSEDISDTIGYVSRGGVVWSSSHESIIASNHFGYDKMW